MARYSITTARLDDISFGSPFGARVTQIVDLGTMPELAQNVAMVRSGLTDATVQVEFWDINGCTLINSDNSSSAALTVSSSPKSLSAFMAAASLNASAAIPGLPNGAVGGRLLVLPSSSGGICVNSGGADDGVGDGTGLKSSAYAPTANSPLRLTPGQTLVFGRYR